MKRLIYISLILGILISCSKIRNDNKVYIGQYEWIFSYSRNIDDGTNVYWDPNLTGDRYAIIVNKNFICYYKNGSFVEKYKIKKVDFSDDGIFIISIKDFSVKIKNNILDSYTLPIEISGSQEGGNYFEYVQ